MGEFAVNIASSYQIGTARDNRTILSAMDISRDEFFANFGQTINDLILAHRKALERKRDLEGTLNRKHSTSEQKARWVDGTPEYSLHIHGLRKLFPGALFIHIVRDVQSVVRSMLNFHREHNADLTVAVSQYELRVPYGVIDTDGVAVTGISEKPLVRQFINAGIYLLNPSIRRLIPNGQRYDIPDLIQQLVKEARPVVCFPIQEYWLDIGESGQYDQAKADIAAGRF